MCHPSLSNVQILQWCPRTDAYCANNFTIDFDGQATRDDHQSPSDRGIYTIGRSTWLACLTVLMRRLFCP
jgi:hypothetical protein